MGKAGIIIIIVTLSTAMFFLLFNLTDFGLNKSLFIAGGAGVGMIIFDVLIPGLKTKKNKAEA